MDFLFPTALFTAYSVRIRDEHGAGWITAAHYLVLQSLARRILAGDDEPTSAKLAADAGCDVRTVRRAKARARARGLLFTRPTFEIVAGRAQQRANRHDLLIPAEPVAVRPKRRRGGQTDRPSAKEGSKQEAMDKRMKMQGPTHAQIQAARASLAAVAARMQAQRAEAWRQKHNPP